MKSIGLFLIVWVVAAVLLFPAVYANIHDKKQDKRITLNVSVQEADVILKALSELPLKESGNLYFSIQQQAQAQLTQKPKTDSSTIKSKKQ